MRPVRPTRTATLAVVLAGLLTLSLVAPVAALAAAGDGDTHATLGQTGADGPGSVAEARQEFDRTAFVIGISGDGTVRWTCRFERTLSNESECQDFRTFVDRFNSEETALDTAATGPTASSTPAPTLPAARWPRRRSGTTPA